MKSLNSFINESRRPSVNADHYEIVFNMLQAEYKNKTKALLNALIADDETYFKHLAQDYATFVTGSIGSGNKGIEQQASKAITAFKASIKLGVNEGLYGGRTSKSLSLKWTEALMLRDFLRSADIDSFGTKEDRESLKSAFNKLDNLVESWR